MFIENKYNKCYYNIIANAKSRHLLAPYETHHIVPRSLGGNNYKNNLANLTIREHYICHLLLTKFTHGRARQKMFYALHRITNTDKIQIKSSRIYEYVRINHSKIVSARCKGKTIFQLYGRSHMHDISDYQRQQIAKSNSERVWTDESRLKLSNSQKQRKINKPESFNLGVPKSIEHKEKLSKSKKEKFKNTCKIYNWIHPTLGNFTGTIVDIKDNFPLLDIRINEITKVLTGVYKSHRNWRLL